MSAIGWLKVVSVWESLGCSKVGQVKGFDNPSLGCLLISLNWDCLSTIRKCILRLLLLSPLLLDRVVSRPSSRRHRCVRSAFVSIPSCEQRADRAKLSPPHRYWSNFILVHSSSAGLRSLLQFEEPALLPLEDSAEKINQPVERVLSIAAPVTHDSPVARFHGFRGLQPPVNDGNLEL